MKKFNLTRLVAFALVAVLGVCGLSLNAQASEGNYSTDASAYCLTDEWQDKIDDMIDEATKFSKCDIIKPEMSTFVAFVPTAAKVVMYDGHAHGLKADVFTSIDKDFVTKASVLYIGVTEDGCVYRSLNAPTKVGYYYAIGMYPGCEDFYPSVAYGVVVILPKPVKVAFEGTKELIGRDAYAGEFEFALLCNGKEIDTVTNTADGSFVFDKITYRAPGVYKYTVVEKNTGVENVTYDETVFDVTVVVTIKCGSLVAHTVVTENGKCVDGIEFVNEYKEPVVPPTDDPVVPPTDDPVDPEDPTVDPVDPEDPTVDPEDPTVDPEVKPEAPEKEPVGPKTGDATNYMVYLMLAVASMASMLAVVVFKRR